MRNRAAIFLTAIVFLVTGIAGTAVYAIPLEQKKVFNKGIDYFDVAGCDAISQAPSTPQDGKRIYMMGDSIVSLAKTALKNKFESPNSGFEVTKIDGVGARSFTSKGAGETNGIEAIEEGKEDIKNSDIVIIAMGTNRDDHSSGESKIFKQKATKAVGMIKSADFNPNAKIYWVKIFSESPPIKHKAIYNDVIDNLTDVTPIEVDAEGIIPPGAKDRVHPSSDGNKKYARIVAEAIGEQAGDADTDTKLEDIGLKEIAKKYKLHSAIVAKVGGDTIDEYNSDQKPISPASTMKVIVADVLLRQKGLDLDKKVRITSDVHYNTPNDDVVNGKSTTLRNALDLMLRRSSNVGANIIMKELGGVSGFTDKAHAAGYKDTVVRNFYSPIGKAKNESTISDQAEAMNHIVTSGGGNYEVAKKALGIASKEDNQYDLGSYKNKWGGTSQIASNVGAYRINGGRYIIGSYHEGAPYTSPTAYKAMHDGTEEIIRAIEGGGGGSSTPAAGQSGAPANCASVCREGGPLRGVFFPKVADKTVLAKAIEDYIKKGWPDSPLIDYSDEFVEYGDKYNVNPLIAVIISQVEYQFGTLTEYVGPGKPGQYNFWAVTHGSAPGVRFGAYPSINEAMEEHFKLLAGKGANVPGLTYIGPPQNLRTIGEIMRQYAPSFENDTPGYIKTILEGMDKIISGGGIESGSATADSTGTCSEAEGAGGISSGTKQELIARALSNDNIVYGNSGEAKKQRGDVKNCLTETTLVGLVSMAEKSGVKIPINALAHDHRPYKCDGSGTLHSGGKAIDIGYYGRGEREHSEDGDKLYNYLYANREELKIDELIWKPPTEGKKCLGGGEPVDCLTYYEESYAVHYHHIHVGFKD